MSNKIFFVNGSPRPDKESCSMKMINYFSNALKTNYDTIATNNALKLCKGSEADLHTHFKEVLASHTLVIVAPLYVDTLPSSVLEYLYSFEVFTKAYPELITHPLYVYGFVNCGFLGGYQNAVALETLERFAERMHFTWGGGLGVGSGAMLAATLNVPREAKMQRPIYEGLDPFVDAMAHQTIVKSKNKQLLVTQDYSAAFFKFSLNVGWISQAGFKIFSMLARPYAQHHNS